MIHHKLLETISIEVRFGNRHSSHGCLDRFDCPLNLFNKGELGEEVDDGDVDDFSSILESVF